MEYITIYTVKGNGHINELPNECPFCHRPIIPIANVGNRPSDFHLDVLMSCPNEKCLKSFVAGYRRTTTANEFYDFTGYISKGNISRKDFSDNILKLSPSFDLIYNQSYYAEQEGLLEICGVGYRKALEFLIKDYAIEKSPDEQDKIEKKLLAACINDYIDNSKIKSVSKRAVWIGNDETHYIRKWEGKNLHDLKALIDLTLHWIEMEKLTEEFELNMPEK